MLKKIFLKIPAQKCLTLFITYDRIKNVKQNFEKMLDISENFCYNKNTL